MLTIEVRQSAGVDEACEAFLDSLQSWAEGCMVRHADAPPPPHDGHDQLTYTTAWATLIRHRGHDDALQFMKRQRDAVAQRHRDTGAWRHGYWKRQEAHHGTEHFELFLGTLLELDPGDDATAAQLFDAAEHFGNWVPDIPPFFDWDTGLYRSVYLGTEYVGVSPDEAINTPDHFRLINIAMLVHVYSGDQRYLELATAHGSRWAEAITWSDRLPLALLPDGPVFEFTPDQAATYRQFIGAAGIVQASSIAPIDRAENFLASNAIQTLLHLWQQTSEDRYRRAAEAIIDQLATQLPDADAGAVSAILRDYRRVTGDTRYDHAVVAAADAAAPPSITRLSLDPDHRLGRGGGGIGKRADMPHWSVDGDRPRPVSPMLLALAAEITGDARRAAFAVDLAHAHFALAQRCFRSGRHHGCSARTVSAVARGHGRDNNAGMVTAVLEPILQHFGRRSTAAAPATAKP